MNDMDDIGPSGRLPEIRVPGAATLAALVAGLVGGLAFAGTTAMDAILTVADPVGALWLRALQMTILPLVTGLLFMGVVATAGAAGGGRIARRTIAFIVAALALSALWGGIGMPLLLLLFPPPSDPFAAAAEDPSGPLPGLGDFLNSLIPENVTAAAADNAMLPVIVFVALFALASTRLEQAPRRALAALFEGLAGAMLVVIGWVLALAPIGVLALGLGLGARGGAAALGTLAHYIVLVSSLGFAILIAAYFVAAIGARLPLGRFAKAAMPAQVVAISTQSSLASLPAMLASARELGVRTTSAEFVLPLAVTLFRATSPAMNVGVAVYAAHMAGVELPASAIAAGVLAGFVTTFGSVSLPGTVSFVASTGPIAAAMGVPLWPLGVLVAVEMLPDIMRTVGNVTMDVAVTAAVDEHADAAPAQGSSSTSQ
jgi:Na+/H+-dicarboxylate symporter